jgi:hypothetical protein
LMVAAANSIPEQQCLRLRRDDLPNFLHAQCVVRCTLSRRVIRCRYGQKHPDGRTIVFPILPAFNLDPAPMAFNKLLCDEQTNARAHGAASGEESFKHSWKIRFRYPYAVILNGQDDAIRGLCIFHRDRQNTACLHRVNRVHDQV